MRESGIRRIILGVLLVILAIAGVAIWRRYVEVNKGEVRKVERIPIRLEFGKKVISFSDGGKNVELAGEINKVDSAEGRSYVTLKVEDQRIRIDLGPLGYKILVSFTSNGDTSPNQTWEMMSVSQILDELKPGRVIVITLGSLINADKPPESECDLECKLAIQEYEKYKGNNQVLEMAVSQNLAVPDNIFGAVQTLMIEK